MHITAICPTYGRFELLRAAVGCFVTQTHADRDLLILNDAPVPIECDVPGVRVINETGFDSLGEKYARLLDEAEGDVIAHWEDDDLYLPWHLASAAEALTKPPLATQGDTIPNRVPSVGVVKPRLAWCVIWDGAVWSPAFRRSAEPAKAGTPNFWKLGGRSSKLCEASTVYHRDVWRSLGGYVPEHSTHSRRALARAEQYGALLRYMPQPCTGYVFCRLHPGIRHGSGLLDRRDGKAIFEAGNQDWGHGGWGHDSESCPHSSHLTPIFDDGRLAAFRRDLPQRVAPHQADAILAALSTAEAAEDTEVGREE